MDKSSFEKTSSQLDVAYLPAQAGWETPAVQNVEKENLEPSEYPPLWRQLLILITVNLAMFIDVISGSALFVIVSHVAKDLDVQGSDISWILTSYAITFAAFQLSAGRLADLTSAGWVFAAGMSGVAVFNLILSFISTPITFFVLRALQGVMAALTIPSAYNITVRTFPAGKARNRALTILGLVGSVSYSIGVIIGGLFETASWRWLLRMFSVLSFIAAGIAVLVVPKQRIHKNLNMREIVLRMDLIGLIFSIGTILLLVLALTSGPEYGWNDPRFYVCFPVSLLSGVAFFFWEAKGIKEIHAMLPAAIWETPTVKPLVFLNLCPFIFWTTSSFGFPTYWQEALGRSSLNAAVRMLPAGISAFGMSLIIQIKPSLISWRRWPIFATIAIAAIGHILFALSDGGPGQKYWSFLVPTFFIGSAACQFAFLAINVFVINSVPPERAGVTGGLMSVIMQLGNALGLAIQAACLDRTHGVQTGWSGYAKGYWAVMGFTIGSCAVCGAVLMYELRKHADPVHIDKDAPVVHV